MFVLTKLHYSVQRINFVRMNLSLCFIKKTDCPSEILSHYFMKKTI